MQTDAQPSRSTLKQVAQAAGVHLSTVSRALRNQANISANERNRIQAIAQRLGYQPDPAMGRLCAYRHARAIAPVFGVADAIKRRDSIEREVIAGFRQQCAFLGFRVVEVPQEMVLSSSAFYRYYRATGLDGALIVTQDRLVGVEQWEGLRVVCFGREMGQVTPTVHTSMADAVGIAFRKAVETGHRRIGGVFFLGPIEERGEEINGAFLHHQSRQPRGRRRVPALVFTGKETRQEIRQCYRRWLERERPDVVIGHSALFHYEAVEAGWEIPEKLRFISLMRRANERQLAGLDLRYAELGKQAAVMLDLLYRANRALPVAESALVTVRPTWLDGESLISIRKSAESSRRSQM